MTIPTGHTAPPTRSADSRPPAGRRNFAGLALRVVVSCVLIFLVATSIDVGDALTMILEADPAPFALAILILVLMAAINGFRWSLIARGLGASLPAPLAWRLVLVGQFVNQGLPTPLGGDTARAWLAARSGVPRATAFHTVVLDRAAALVSLVALVGFAAPVLLGLPTVDLWFILAGPAAAVAVLIGAITVDKIMALLLPKRIAALPLFAAVARISLELRWFLVNARRSGPSVVLAIVGQLGAFVAFWMIARSMDIPISLDEIVVLLPPIVLLTALPLSLAGWGLREGAMVFGFAIIGLPPAQAFAFSISCGIAGLLSAIPGAVFWFSAIRKNGGGP